ncbi:MAG: HEAT repeat domain-containing protein [Bacteroidales bacterium]
MFFLIARQAKSADPAARKRAAEKLGHGDRGAEGAAVPRHVALLLDLIADSDAAVRTAAFESLGRVAHAGVVDRMATGLKDLDKLGEPGATAVRDAAAGAFQSLGAAAVPALVALGKDKNVKVREAVMLALGNIGGEKAEAALAAALEDSRSSVRQAAVQGLAKTAVSGKIGALAVALQHRDPATRKSAVEALAEVHNPEAANGIARLTRDTDRGVREAAVRALGRQATPAAIDALLVVFEGGDRDLRDLAAAALKDLDWQPATPAQRALRAIVRGDVAGAASEGAVAVELLAVLIADKAPATRRAAAEGLGRTGQETAVRPLLVALQDQDPGVRQAAGDALVQLGAIAVRHIAESVHEAVHSVAPQIVARIGTPAVSPLVDLLEQGDTYHADPDDTGRPLVVTRVSDDSEAERAVRAAQLLSHIVAGGADRLDASSAARLARLRDIVRVQEVMPTNRRELPTTVVETVVDCQQLRDRAKRLL